MMIRQAAIAVGLALAASATFAAGKSPFAKFTPLVGTIPAGSLPEPYPFKLSSPLFSQVTIAVRDPSQATRFDTGNWDMHTANETGPDAGRYLFTVFETGQAGIQRTDLTSMTTTTIWQSPAAAPALNSHVAFDASRWAPWGAFLTAEEFWSDAPAVSIYGRLFEVTNPLEAPADVVFKHRNVLPRVSHEGLVFDKKNNLYFIDERNGGAIYKYTSRKPNARNGDDFFAAGQSFVLRVGDGTVTEATGAFTWVAMTDLSGAPLPGTVVVTDANGVTSLDGRATANLPAFLGTNYDRPEDMEIKRKHGREMIFVATTTNHKVFTIDLETDTVKLFVSRDTIDKASGQPVGNDFANPDNLAIDADGNIYVVEDQPGGLQDAWFAYDEDDDGVAESVAKWATLSTVGAEGTGLYFDRFRPNTAYYNVQHPASGLDRTIMITGPCVCPKDD